nr:uncharacterized protein LOC128676351 [Plodia interpunctella]
MYRVLFLAVVFLAVVFLAGATADITEDLKKCERVIHPRSHRCCKRDPPVISPKPDLSAIKECMQLPGKPPSCERHTCIAMKRGIATSDGKIDKVGLQKKLDEDFSDNPELLKLMKEKCVDGDISNYGETDMCEPLKLMICMDFQFAASCPEWDDTGDCAGLKELVAECMKE